MGDFAASVMYCPSRIPAELIAEMKEMFRDVEDEYAGVGLLLFAAKGSYPGFMLSDLCGIKTPFPVGTVILCLNDSGDRHMYVFDSTGMTRAVLDNEVSAVAAEEERRALRQENESLRAQLRQATTELAVLKGK